MISWRICALVLAILISPAAVIGQSLSEDPGGASDLVFLTEQAPPFNYMDNGTVKGISIDLLDRVLSRMGAGLDRSRIRLQDWSVSYDAALKERNAVLFIVAFLPERAPSFKWAGPVFSTKTSIYALKGRNVRLNLAGSSRDLERYRIAVVHGEYPEQMLINMGAKNLSVVQTSEPIVEMMLNGSVDAWACSDMVGTWVMKRAGISRDDIEVVYDLGDVDLFYAFNKDAPDRLVEEFQDALNDAKENNSLDGTTDLEKILYRYLPVQYAASIVPDRRAVELVNKAFEDIRDDAPGTLRSISSRDPLYLDEDYPDLYIFVYDTDENWVANANNPRMVGANFKGKADVSGKKFSDEIVAGARKNGSGWVNYIYINPVVAGLYYKTTYYRLADGSDGRQYIVCCGKYMAQEHDRRAG